MLNHTGLVKGNDGLLEWSGELPLIQLDRDTLASRGREIRRMLRPLALVPGGPAWAPRSLQAGGLELGVHDDARPNGPVTDWRFSTKSSRIRANYHERWGPVSGESRMLHLERAYLTIYQSASPAQEIELLALHCEPNEPDSDGAIYKRGPHIHIVAAQDPIPRAHIALTRGHIDEVLAATSNLTEALGWSIVMIQDEVLARYG